MEKEVVLDGGKVTLPNGGIHSEVVFRCTAKQWKLYEQAPELLEKLLNLIVHLEEHSMHNETWSLVRAAKQVVNAATDDEAEPCA